MRFIFLLTGIIFFCNLAGQSNGSLRKTDAESDDLKGKVKEVRAESGKAVVKSGKIILGDKEGPSNYLNTYNEDGYYLETKEFRSDNSLYTREIFIYDKNKNLSGTRGYDEHDSLYIWSDRVYDEKGRLLKKKWDGTVSITWDGYACSYDSKGNMLEEINTGEVLEEKFVYRYNERGNRIETVKFYMKELSEKITCTYNEKGYLLSSKKINDDSTTCDSLVYTYGTNEKILEEWKYTNKLLEEKTTYKYDAKGNCIEIKTCETSGSCNKKSFTKFNAKGLETESKMYVDDRLDYHSVQTYDSKGWLIEFIYYSMERPGTKFITKYYYDPAGNWIKRVEYRNNLVEEITIRKIIYF